MHVNNTLSENLLLVCSRSDMFSCQEEERSVLLGVCRLKFVAEPEPPLLFQLQPADRLPQRAAICADHTKSRACREAQASTRDDFPYLVHFLFFFLHLSIIKLDGTCTFEEGELLEEARGHKGVGETEEKAAEEQSCGADVDRVRS